MRSRIAITVNALFVLLLLATPLHAAKVEQVWKLDGDDKKPSVDFFAESIQRLADLPGFQCRFDQLMVFSDGGGQKFSGQVALLKPKRFRWSYEKPYDQLYIGDGSVIWHYEPDLMQAERLSDLEQVDPAVMQLLDGRVAVKDVEVMRESFDSKLQIRRYQVRIRDSADVWLGFNKLGDLVSIERTDLLGNSNRMRLSACSYVAPSPNLFSFTPPADVDVLDLRSANGE